MRYMRWNYDDYLTCPVDLHDRIVETANQEAERQKHEALKARMRRR